MKTRSGMWSLAFAILTSGVGCQEQQDDAKQAVEAASALMDMAKETAEAAKAAEAAANAAEAEAEKQIADGTDPEVAKQQVELAKSMAAMKAMGGGGAVVNWRQLEEFLPEKLGDYAAKGKLKGSTQKMGGSMSVSTVKRSYAAGDKKLSVEISDAFMAPMLKAPFAMAAMMEEDTSEGYKKGVKVAGHTAIVEWNEGSKRSKALLLVGGRFMVNVSVRNTDTDDEAQKVASSLQLDALSKLLPKTEKAAGEPG